MRNLKANYNKSLIMKRAWKLFKNQKIRTMEMFSSCLKQSWNIAKNNLKNVNIDALYKKYYNQVYFFILQRIGNKIELAKDLAQETFIKANKHLENYDVHTAKLNTWLLHIAKNIVIDNFRTNDADKYVNVGEFVNDDGKETFQIADKSIIDNVENNELKISIDKAMSSLKPKYRRIAELFFIEQQKYEEIAETLNIPMGSVKGMISRVRTMLQKELESVRIA